MTIDKAKEILTREIKQIEDNYDAFEVQFMGGEPLMNYRLIKEVSEWLWSVNWPKKILKIFVPTNGTLLNEEMKKWFNHNKDRICLGLSFDGDYAMQNSNRSSSADQIDLSFFSSVWPEQSVKLTISPRTVTSLFNGVSYLWNKGFKIISADLAMGKNVGWNKQHLILFKNELRKFEEYFETSDSTNIFSMLNMPILSLLDKTNNYSGKQCNCGESLTCVDVDGKTYPCHLFSPISISNDSLLKEVGKFDFCNHHSFNAPSCRECYLNPICNNHCYGMNYITYGNILNSSPFHCSAFKLLFLENCRIQHKLARRDGNINITNKIEQIINNLQYQYGND